MVEFLEFCKAHPWEIAIMLFVAASFGAIVGYFISGFFASGKIADKIAQRENPKHVEKRINIKPRCSIK